jgi:poly(hydroxyalkanoate) granule-associated protein
MIRFGCGIVGNGAGDAAPGETVMARSRKPKVQENSENVARKIWLAGLGAYGKSLEDAQGQLDKASQEATRKFSELVSKGQSIEDQSKEALRERINEAKGRLSGARDRITEVAGSNTRSVEEMISRVREKMGFDEPVHDKLDALTRQVNAIARAVGALTERKPAAARKSAARKPAAIKPATANRKPAARTRRTR